MTTTFRTLLCTLTLAASLSCKKNTDNPNPSPTPPPASGASIDALQCGNYLFAGFPVANAAFTGSFTLSYAGGNGQPYAAGTAVASEGVTGLTATLQAGTLATGNGSFTFTVSGTPVSAGTANFTVAFGPRTCTVSLPVRENDNFVQYGTPFTGVPDRQDAVIYQVNIRAFSTQSNFQGVIARLDSIKALGVNVIYLMPIYPVGVVNSVNSPYCVRDYRSVNPEFGTLTDLRQLVDGAHTRNMSVMLDWVANHTSWDNGWITAHSDWYLKNTSGTIVPPPGTGWDDVAQLDYNNATMRLEMIRSMKYWVYTANVDGFRFDYADGPPASFWRQAIDSLRAINTHRLLLLAEGSRSDHFASGFDMTFGFGWYAALKSVSSGTAVTALDALNTSEFNGATNGQQVVRYITNHDVNGSDGTPLALFGGLPGSMAYFVTTAYMKGIPMIYNGQEVGTPFRLQFPFTATDLDWSLNPAVKAEYKQVIAFRNGSTAVRRGTLTSYNSADVTAFVRESGTEKVLVLANLRNSAQTYAMPAALANTAWTNALSGAAVSTGTQLSLPAYSYLILRN